LVSATVRSSIAGKSRNDRADVGQRGADRVLELGQLVVAEPAVEVEVHDRLAVHGPARVADPADAAAALALGGDDRVQQARELDPARGELARDRVDEERQIVGVGLQHRADRLVAVLLAVGLKARTAIASPSREPANSYSESTSPNSASGAMPSELLPPPSRFR
jgi:hypothetical protein